MIRLCDDVFIVGSGSLGFDLTHPSDCHVYLVNAGSEAALVDAGAGMAVEQIMSNIKATDTPLDQITHLFLTHAHADHAGGAHVLSRVLPNLRVVASPPVADIVTQGDEIRAGVDRGKSAGTYPESYRYRRCKVSDAAVDGQQFTLGDATFTALHTPGHSIGHTCYTAAIGGHSLLFSGDHLFFGGQIALQNTWDCDVQAYATSLERLTNIGFDRLLPGHLAVSMNGADRHIRLATAALNSGILPRSIV